ncbi:hypothetical protein [Streptomyces sp. DSM 41634]|uniref:hypothetical protein n=1 Tax=Streptomyces sp. DSM 41634 TaxID=3448656 RepID=UPI0028867B05|nr:hypothetical protein [Streptomyces sp. DSM 41633]
MKAQESRIAVQVVEYPTEHPQEAWDLQLDHLDMYVEEVMEELQAIRWAEGSHAPNHCSIQAKSSRHNWGGSSTFSEIVMQVSTGTVGGVGATAIGAAVKIVYERLKARSQGESWDTIPSADEAVRIARSRLHLHYGAESDKLRVTSSEVDAGTQRYDLEFAHEDGRQFGATVGAIDGIPSCTHVWMRGAAPS